MTQATRYNGRRSRDPGYKPTPPATDFWPLPAGHELTICGRCAAAVPATDTARRTHRRFHEQVDAGDPR